MGQKIKRIKAVWDKYSIYPTIVIASVVSGYLMLDLYLAHGIMPIVGIIATSLVYGTIVYVLGKRALKDKNNEDKVK